MDKEMKELMERHGITEEALRENQKTKAAARKKGWIATTKLDRKISALLGDLMEDD